MRYILIPVIFILVATVLFAAGEQETGYMGVYTEVVSELPKVDGAPAATGGVQILDTREDTPAYKSGLRRGDIMIAFADYAFDVPSDKIDAKFKEIMAGYHPGDQVRITILREEITKKLASNGLDVDPKPFLKAPDAFIEELPDKSNLNLTIHKEWTLQKLVVTLGRRNDAAFPGLPDIEKTDLTGKLERSYWEPWVDQVVKRYDIQAEYQDLRQRLQNIEAGDDGYRLELVSAIHRDPFLAEPIARNITDIFLKSSTSKLNEVLLYMTAKKYEWTGHAFTKLPVDADEEGFKKWFVENMDPLVSNLLLAYKAFSPEDKDFLMKHRFELTDVFAENVYIHDDQDIDRLQRNRKTIELGNKIDLATLYKASDQLSRFTTDTQEDVFAWMEKHPASRTIETPWGKIGFGTSDYDWWRDGTYKFIYDPGGNDVYSDGTATAISFEQPVSWIVDMKGDDAYQSTSPNGAQASGMPGLGMLMDYDGDDTYIGQRWAQGTGFMGVGLLLDVKGNDSYHGTEFIQGAGLFGLGILGDYSGNDEYFGTIHAQGCGFTKGLGVLMDFSGDDKGYATGKLPTNYGDPGIFDAWSQGCGIGFRGIASGGIGIVIDADGNDKWEAGNFSQGGGYYYGMGIFRACGNNNDTYIGSRYAQGFCAHQAIGVWLEEGGDDIYLTRQGVNAGLAWDECVTVFIDEAGNDYYNGGTGFSLGASAHNSFMFWLDKDGRDQYIYPGGPALAGGNDYHGGYSLSFFIDQGDEEDIYTCTKVTNDIEMAWPEYGIFRDGKGEFKSPLSKPQKQ